MRTTRLLAALGLAALAAAGMARADTIHLINGQRVEGEVVARDRESVTVRIGDLGTITFRAAEVARIVADERDGTRMAEEALRRGVAVAEPPAPATPREVPGPLEPIPALPGALQAPADYWRPQVPGALAAEIRREVWRLGRTSGPATQRHSAMQHLEAIGWPAVPAVTDALSDTANWYRRSNAARVLARLATPPDPLPERLLLRRAVPELIRRVETDPEPWVRVHANDALIAITGEAVVVAEQDPTLGTPDARDAQGLWRRWWDGRGRFELALIENRMHARDRVPIPERTLPAGMPREERAPLSDIHPGNDGIVNEPGETSGFAD